VKTCTYKSRLLRVGYTLLLLFTVARADSPDRVASVHGKVTNDASGAGLRKARLALTPIGKGSAYPVVTGDNGTFAIENIVPGDYRLSSESTGFLDAFYSAELRLSAGDKVTGIEIKMTPQAVLSGRVLDQDGDPWPHASVEIYRSVWEKGRRKLDFTNSSEVDDRGEFRIPVLAPGRYYVVAEPEAMRERQQHPDVNDEPTIHQQPTWYPSSRDAESSVPILLTAGQQLSGLDIRLRRGAESNLHIRGKLSGLQNVPALASGQRQFGPAIIARRASAAMQEERDYNGTVQADGSFEITGVVSGAYELWVKEGFPRSILLGQSIVQVNDRDVENLSIEVHPPQTLKGSIRIEGGEAMKPPHIFLDTGDFPGIDPSAAPKEDGTFEVDDIGFGPYRLYVQDQDRKRVYLKTLRYGNAESSDGTFTLSSYGVPLEVVFSARGARLSGTVAGRAATPQVILIPETKDPARAAVFDQNGVFTLESISPGSYQLYAFENVPEGIWLDPDFLKEVQSAGTAFKAAEDDVKTIQVQLLGKAETDRILAKLGIE
jgi:Carboxypeptidase regulatory-like domain